MVRVNGRVLRKGDHYTLLVENSGAGGFYTEIARTCVIGKATDEMRDEVAFAIEARNFTLGMLRPGASCKDIWESFNRFMREHGKPEEGRKELVALEAKAKDANDGYAQYDIGLGRALLAENTDEELTLLSRLESTFSNPFNAMAEEDRHTALASILREEVRVLSQLGKVDAAQDEIHELETLARETRDTIIEDRYESARGYVLYASGDYAGAAMAEVIRNTALLSADDRLAIATYIASLPPRQGPKPPEKKR